MPVARVALLLSSVGLLCGMGCDAEEPAVSVVEGEAPGPLGKADATGSCRSETADHCGSQSPSGNCFCDSFCVVEGSCCGDVQAVCPDEVDGPRLLVEDLDRPESALVDPVTGTMFITNLAHGILDIDPLDPPEGRVGFISRHFIDGGVHTERFAEDFFSPKGMAIADRILYVADPFEVVAIDIRTAQKVASYTVDDVGMFNDMGAGPDGTVYVTDSPNGILYRIDPLAPEDEALIPVAQDPRFEFPNGIAVDGRTAYVVTTGILPGLKEGLGTKGRLFAVDLDTEAVREIEGVEGRWDGVAVLDDGTVVLNDFFKGDVHTVDPLTGESDKLMGSPASRFKHPAGIADLNVNGSTLLLPSMFTDELWVVPAPVRTGD